MQKSKHDVWVGLFVLIGAAAILFLALKAGNLLTLSFDSGYTVVARFDNIGGLKRQAAVKSAGVVVGRVQSITFDTKTYQAQVELALNKGVIFRKTPQRRSSLQVCWASSTSVWSLAMVRPIWWRATRSRAPSRPSSSKT